MKKTVLIIIILIAAVASVVYFAKPELFIEEDKNNTEITLGVQGDSIAVEIGNEVQDFILEDYDAYQRQLSDLEKMQVVLYFWDSKCDSCKEDMKYLEDTYQKYQDRGFEFLAINKGEALFEAKGVTKALNLSYPILLDKEESVYSSYEIEELPTLIMIDNEGEIFDIKRGSFTSEVLKEMMKDFFVNSVK